MELPQNLCVSVVAGLPALQPSRAVIEEPRIILFGPKNQGKERRQNEPFVQSVCSLGSKGEIIAVAPTQRPDVEAVEEAKAAACSEDFAGYTVTAKKNVLDRWLDYVVRASGSQVVFFFILTALATWVFLGIPFHDLFIWQVFISDAQAILSYIFDSLLMRQQLNGYEQLQTVAAGSGLELSATAEC